MSSDYGYIPGAASGGDVTMGAVAPPSASSGFPVSGDPRQKTINNPAQVRIDANNLRMLDYPAPDTGNAYDPKFMAAVAAFQRKMGAELVGPADGLIGPTTRAVLEDAVRALSGGNPNVLPPDLGGGGGGGLKNASAVDSFPGGTVGLVAAGAAVLGLGWYLLKK